MQDLPFRPTPWGAKTILPDYGGACIASLSDFVAQVLGVGPANAAKRLGLSDCPRFDRVLFFILDGFGYRKAQNLFDAFPDLALRSLGQQGQFVPLTSVFPSTTVAALVSISTGLTPLEHGMIGYRLYLRETGSVTNMIRFSMHGGGGSDSALKAGLDLNSLLIKPTFHQQMAEQGVAAHTVLPQYISTSGLSSALYRGSTSSHPAAGLSDMLVTARHLLNHADGKAFVSVYWPGLDTVAHVRGPETDAYVAELRAVDDAIRRELVGRIENTLLVFTSDHGFVPMRSEDYLHLDRQPEIERSLLLPPVGEPRATYFYARNGAHDRLVAAIQDMSADGLVLLDPKELIEAELLGTTNPHPEIGNRIGDAALVATGRSGIFHAYPNAIMLRGMHGGLTEDEMLVPLVVSEL